MTGLTICSGRVESKHCLRPCWLFSYLGEWDKKQKSWQDYISLPVKRHCQQEKNMSGLESFTENSFSEIMLAGDLVFPTEETARTRLHFRTRSGRSCAQMALAAFWTTEVQRKSFLWQTKNVGPQYLALGFGHSLRTAKWGLCCLWNVVHSLWKEGWDNCLLSSHPDADKGSRRTVWKPSELPQPLGALKFPPTLPFKNIICQPIIVWTNSTEKL